MATWPEPANKGFAITSYNVEYRKSTVKLWTPIAHTGTVRTATIPWLDKGATYQVRVNATNSVGTGNWSNTQSASITTGPDSPVLTAAPSNGAISATWSVPANNGVAITHYQTAFKAPPNYNQWAPNDTPTLPVDLIRHPLIINGGTYDVRVRATNGPNESDYGPWSNVVRVVLPTQPDPTTLPTPEPPTAPVVTLRTVNSGEIETQWFAPAAGFDAISSYDVQYKKTSVSSWTDFTHDTLGTTAEITGLENGVSYDIRVNATLIYNNVTKTSAWSDLVSGTPRLASFPAAPEFTLTDGDGEIGVMMTTNDNGDAIIDYEVVYREESVSTWTDWPHIGPRPDTVITGLTNGTKYYVSLTASNSLGPGPTGDL